MKEHALKSIRRAGVPLACFETADPAATIAESIKSLNGKAEETPLFQWDMIGALTALNQKGAVIIADVGDKKQTQNPAECLERLASATESPDFDRMIVFFHNAQVLLKNPACIQGFWNLRDKFKGKGSTCVMLTPSVTLPEELKQDVILVSESLPSTEDIRDVIKRITEEAGITAQDETKTIETLRGLMSVFATEQVLALSLTKEGIDIPTLLSQRRSFIAKTGGIEIRTDPIKFDDIAGYSTVKTALTRKIKGKRPPGLVLWLDEAEKAFAGSNSDTSGVTQDQVGTLLTWFQDKLNADQLSAMMLVGFPGTAKSAIAMATHNEAKCECIRLDMGSMKGSLVGESERKIRQALKQIDAVCPGHILCISTCNSIANIPSPFISRHAFGTYFFDLPGPDENKAIWALKRKKYSIADDDETPASEGWTGREIQQCCFLANDLGLPLKEAANYIAPFCKSGKKEIEDLRGQANGRWISASTPGIYELQTVTPTGRRIERK